MIPNPGLPADHFLTLQLPDALRLLLSSRSIRALTRDVLLVTLMDALYFMLTSKFSLKLVLIGTFSIFQSSCIRFLVGRDSTAGIGFLCMAETMLSKAVAVPLASSTKKIAFFERKPPCP
ncbi:hypothetical protein shim_05540 [Shimia sp. SK013]|nr:hypothetical protein shim_05540 [Shimia sp. SK013]